MSCASSGSANLCGARFVAAATVLLVVSLWAALPVGAGDPLGQITEFTTGLTPNSQPNRIADGPDGNLWFTEVKDPGRIAKIGAGCVPAPAPSPLTAAPRFTG
jgi:hypothetical protein